jgi:FAD synthase
MPSKQEILENLNVDYLLIIEFNQDVAKISHQDFFKQYLNNLNILEFIIGFDFTYGHFGQGNSETIKDDYYKEVKVTKISKLEICNEKIGSSQIKNALENGNISKANDLLGFNFFMRFEIIDTKDNKAYLNSLNLNILNKQNYNVSINNITSILYNEHKTYIENTFNQNIGDIIKVTFLN